MRKVKLLVSVSGGRTSGLMAYLLWTRFKDVYEMIFVFANTGREKEETLIFVNNIEKHFGIPIVWVEAITHKGRKGCTHKIISFETANRDGSVFKEVIAKYGLPNKGFLHCTRELKTNTIRSYARSIGWKDHKKYMTAIGYRADEPARVNLKKAFINNQWYPLYDWQIKKSDVAVFWLRQFFDLKLKDYEGNCDLCHKKTKRKLLTQIQDGSSTDFHQEMEDKYSLVKAKNNEPRHFFRNSESITDLIEQSKEPFKRWDDQSLNTNGSDYDFELDEAESCEESCEPF